MDFSNEFVMHLISEESALKEQVKVLTRALKDAQQVIDGYKLIVKSVATDTDAPDDLFGADDDDTPEDTAPDGGMWSSTGVD